MARGLDLDLVEVAPMANPPVCRIMDYGKFRYEEAQKAKEARRKIHPRHGEGGQVPAQDRQGRFRHQDAAPQGVPRGGPQGEGHPAVPRPGGCAPRARPQDPRRRDRAVGPSARSRTRPEMEGRNMTLVLAPDKKAQDAIRKAAQAERKRLRRQTRPHRRQRRDHGETSDRRTTNPRHRETTKSRRPRRHRTDRRRECRSCRSERQRASGNPQTSGDQ